MVFDTSNNGEFSQLKQDFAQRLKEMEQTVKQCELEDRTSGNYYDIAAFKNYSNSLDKQCALLKVQDSMAGKSARVTSQIKSYRERLQNGKKIEKLKLECQDVEKKLEGTKKRSKEIDKISDFLGFNMELKDDVIMVQFTKLPIKDPETKFQFDILDNNKFKVLKCDPPQCLDTSEIEDQVDRLEANETNKFCKLILLIRQELIAKYQD